MTTPTETVVFTALRAFVLGLVDCEVIRLPANRVAMPVGEFIALSPLTRNALATNVTEQTGQTKTVSRSSQFSIQVDCYGPNAGDAADKITKFFRDQYGCDALAATSPDIAPLYATDAHQTPLIDGEAQYVERWTFDCVMQVNPAHAVPQPAATELHFDPVAGIRSVDRAYSP